MNVVSASGSSELAALLQRGWSVSAEDAAVVGSILSAVRSRGDAALVDYTRRFDDEAFDISKLRVAILPRESARSLVPHEVADALELVRDRVARFHERQRQVDVSYAEEDGTRYGLYRRPLESIAALAPGGAYPAPVAVLMSVIPAKLAGVSRTVVLSPPHRSGHVHPAVLFACSLCEVDELYAVGGAHGVAAAAFGTESIARVDKIVGPGGVWVTEGKRQVVGWCGIDALSGPAEVLVVADDGANSEYVAGELLAQAEHGQTSRLAVLSESRPLLDAVAQLLDTLDLPTLERGAAISRAISEKCALIHAASRDEVFDVIERFAPANLCLQVRDASAYLPRIRRAGAIFVGDVTPLS
ncbi:MAG TPA: histidinol dehydrogenase, partial [Candidatus Baltobacteraceae bacterium]|nr:histidinol dehydrogenase [Candidatus Baltobacteraceae bacterium]